MTYNDLCNDIKKSKIKNIIIVYGNETFYVDRGMELIVESVLNQDFIDMNLKYYDNISEKYSDFIEDIHSVPFMDNKKVIVVNEFKLMVSGDKKNSDDEPEEDEGEENLGSLEKSILELFKKVLSDDSLILIFLFKEKKPNQKKKLVKFIKENGAIYEINRIKEAEFSNYVKRYFEKDGYIIGNVEINYISSNCGYFDYEPIITLYNLNNELDKIKAGVWNDKKIEKYIIENLLTKSIDSNIFSLIDGICNGKYKTVYNILQDMLLNGLAGQFIIAMIVRQCRLLLDYQYLEDKGYSQNEICSAMNIKGFAGQKIARITKIVSRNKLENNFRQIIDVDRRIKSGQLDGNIGLDIICMAFNK